MKKFLKRRWHGVPMAVIVAVLVTALAVGGVFAAGLFTRTIPSTITVTPIVTPADLKVYSDIDCTVEVTSFTVGSVEVGSTVSLPKVWVKNTGSQTYTSVSVSTDLSSSIATMSVPGWPRGETAPGTKWDANIQFTGVGDSSGEQSFNIMFNGNY